MTTRILLTSDYLPPSSGGVEQVVQNLAINLNNEGLEIGLFTLDSGAQDFDLKENNDIYFNTATAIDLTNKIGLQSMVSVNALKEFRKAIEEFKPDIVHAHNRFFYTTALAATFTVISEYKLITTLHLGDISRIDGLGGEAAKAYEQTVSRFAIAQSDKTIGVSKAAERIANSLGANNSVVIRNAVDVEEFKPSESDDRTLLYIGRLVRNNGVLDLVEALPSILHSLPDLDVQIVGDGPLKDEIENRIRRKNISNNVTISTYVEDITDMYDKATVFCRPSYSEGMPLTMLEAMASGVPPVVTEIAGVPEVVSNRRTGILLPPGDPNRLKESLIELFENTELREKLSENAREYVVHNHSWKSRTKQVMNTYERTID